DTTLRNPWGMTASATSPFWVADNAVNFSTLYSGAGVKQGLTVTVGGNPTGLVNNGNAAAFNGDNFIFAAMDGTIRGWRGALGTTAETLSINPGSVFTGLAIGTVAGNTYLYGADFAKGTVDVFPNAGAPPLTGSFTD